MIQTDTAYYPLLPETVYSNQVTNSHIHNKENRFQTASIMLL